MIGAFDFQAGGLGLLLVPMVVVLAILLVAWHFHRSRSCLEQWAEQNGFEILESQYRNLFKGPYFWTSSRAQTVYRVKVRDHQRNVRSGWVRCGGWFSGLCSDKTEVRWES
jgi:hypothetical protein